MATAVKDMWPKNGPDTLEDTALRCIARNLGIIAVQGMARLPATGNTCDESYVSVSTAYTDIETESTVDSLGGTSSVDPEIKSCYHLRKGICLPKIICDRLLDIFNNESDGKEMTYEQISIFSDNQVTGLSEVDLRCLADHSLYIGLKMISQQPILELTMPCMWRCLPIIKSLKTLRSLRLEKEPTTNAVDAFIQGQHTDRMLNIQDLGSQVDGAPVFSVDEEYYRLTCPNLRKLVLHNLQFRASQIRDYSFNSMVVSSLLSPLHHLTYLSLSMCRVRLEELTVLSNMTMLVGLNVSNIKIGDFSVVLQILQHMCYLKHLDLSQGDQHGDPVFYPDGVLRKIVKVLPSLISLDLSGTNLAGFEPPQMVCHRMGPTVTMDEEENRCSIPGLEGRHFEFLGLYNCAYDACSRKYIPAKKVTGDSNSNQVVLAVKSYIDNYHLLHRALNDLFSMFRYAGVENHCQALEGILAAMKMYPRESNVQISGSASLFYIAKGEQKGFMTFQQKRKMVNLLLAAMSEHCFDQTMMRNASLTLCHLNLPGDVMFCYERLVKQLLDMLKYDFRDEFIHRLCIFLVNCLACQVDGREKELVGRMGTVETMLQIISRKSRGEECDDILEVAWSTLWNVTDETPSNCQKFLAKNGMQLFVQCLEKFNNKPELLRNMMGLMGNIAEVDHLRKHLLCTEYVQIFSDLLDSESDGIEVSYNACGVLSHLCYNGPDVWMLEQPTRQSVTQRMEAAIRRWPLDSRRNINYRSFEPILLLVNHFDTPVVQHWACWALCNLTRVSPDKYCRLLESGTGRSTLERVYQDSRPAAQVKDLLRQTLRHLHMARCNGYKQNNDDDDDRDDVNCNHNAEEDMHV